MQLVLISNAQHMLLCHISTSIGHWSEHCVLDVLGVNNHLQYLSCTRNVMVIVSEIACEGLMQLW